VLEESYRERNRVERLVDKMKQFRAVATRCDKLGDSFLASIQTGPDLHHGKFNRQQH
jgi:transposase